MSNTQESRCERVARYKEERRKQLAEQFNQLISPSKGTTKSRLYASSLGKDGNSSSNSEGPRPTRASKLRAAAISQENLSSQVQINKQPSVEKNLTNDSSEMKIVGSKRIERDKSNKRKSNLNRALNSEEVPSTEYSNPADAKDRRRRRRFFPAEVFESSSLNSGHEKDRNHKTTTASVVSPSSTSDTASSSLISSKILSKSTELTVHMENARRSVTAAPDSGKTKLNSKRIYNLSPKTSTIKLNEEKDSSLKSSSSVSYQRSTASDDERSKSIASRMEGLSALTKQTLARVERLTNKTRESPIKIADSRSSKKVVPESSTRFSILKKKTEESSSISTAESSISVSTSSIAGPISILKRKISQDENRLDGTGHSSNNTPPVTFSPSVLEPTTTRRKQGILKKRRSLDESAVLRHRSCSPDVSNKVDSKSILKNQRRSSLEELRRTRSPDTPKHSILKRRSSKYDEDDHSLNSPQGILKRKSGASSASSTGSSPHVSITTAVILAAACGAEMVLDSDGEAVKPILKKKSFSEEHSYNIETPVDAPKPILKKKSSTDTDDSEEKPKPILKLPKSSIDRETFETSDTKSGKHKSLMEECEVKPILKLGSSREELPRPRLSFCRNDSRYQISRRSNTICSDFDLDSFVKRDRDVDKPRPFSVYELVKTFEQTSSTGAVPKRSYKRNTERQRTQPVTVDELAASRNLGRFHAHFQNIEKNSKTNLSKSIDFQPKIGSAKSLDTDDELNMPSVSTSGKMTSDSAFQSLGSGLEQDKDQISPEQIKTKSKFKQELSKINIESKSEKHKREKLSTGMDSSDKLDDQETPPKTIIDSSIGTMTPSPKSVLKKHHSFNSHYYQKSILKTESFVDKDDEGISCNDSDSNSDCDIASANKDEDLKNGEWKSKKQTEISVDSISEGESSGGREVESILRNETEIKHSLSPDEALSKGEDSLDNCVVFSKTPNILDFHNQSLGIANIQNKLQERGESDWKKRIQAQKNVKDEIKMLKEKNKYNDELSEESLLLSKKSELEASSNKWKQRIEKSDAEMFSVAGKLNERRKDDLPVMNIPINADNKNTPQAKRFKLKEDLEETNMTTKKSNQIYPEDITLKSFFNSTAKLTSSEQVVCSLEDFDAIPRHTLLVIKKNVKVQKRRETSRNPIKALAVRSDITTEYTEVTSSAAEREKKRLNIEKLAKNSNKAIEALAGLASDEDFKAITLKKSAGPRGQLPWKDPMLLQVKGRRHVQTRLVEPTANSINEGDNYILITPQALYTYTGAYSNVIEQSRVSDIVNHIQKTGDLGCKVNHSITITASDKNSRSCSDFWKILGETERSDVIEAGHPDEDETYESNILKTNMIYKLEKDELIPYDKYWGRIPKYEMLTDTNILVFDFGSELYVWSGKNANLAKKRLALKLAKEIWEEGYDYSQCNICPLNIASMLGARSQKILPLKDKKRPDWALFAKLTQHRETILFKEKFIDWPDYSRVIRVKTDETLNNVRISFDIEPYDVEEMIKENDTEPDLIVENTHLGRGDKYFDEETKRLFVYETLKLTGWRVSEFSHELLPDMLQGHLYEGNSYIFQWDFRQTVKGRELSGNPSKHASIGRDRCVFFCWQGRKSSVNEKGAAALLTVELDRQSAPQIRVAQNSEPAAFLRLFNGNLVISRGKSDAKENKNRLFILRGEKENEIHLIEVLLAMSSLRSRTSFVLINQKNSEAIIWHGAQSHKVQRKNIKFAVDNFIKNKSECDMDGFEDIVVTEIEEGSENEEFLNLLEDKGSYFSLSNIDETFNHNTRMFRMSSLTGEFLATEVLCPHRSDQVTPFPLMQTDIYSSTQPALFLIDNHHELWLWQGYWPENITEGDNFDQTGTGAVRWQAERKAAMQTAVAYWNLKYDGNKPLTAYLVWAGLEPIEFKNLFPTWEDKPDVADTYQKEGKKDGIIISLGEQLALLSRTTFPLYELLQRPLPEGVDPTNLEKYLSTDDFSRLLSMTKDEFERLPSWKKTALKKEKGLF